MGSPFLGIRLGNAIEIDAVRKLVAGLRPWCRAGYASIGDPVDAWFVTAGSLPDVVGTGKPICLWFGDPRELDASSSAALAAVTLGVTTSGLGAESVVPRLVRLGGLWGRHATDMRRVPVMMPFVRRRERRRHGLPDDYVVALGGNTPEEPPGGLVDTALALAAAAVVRGSELADALIWGTPTVTTARWAEEFGLEPGVEVLVADDARLHATAASLCGDDRLGSRLSVAARTFAEERLDTRPPALAVASCLGLTPGTVEAAHLVEERLDELVLPPDASFRSKVGRRLAELKRP